MSMIERKWTDIGSIDQIPRRGARVIRTQQGCVSVFRTINDSVFALEDRCPHRGGPLSQGIVHGTSVTCPLHNWVLSLEMGEAQGADEGRARTFPLCVAEGRILVDLTVMLARRPILEKTG
jgi:nitrite reductase (NADH) small subunit